MGNYNDERMCYTQAIESNKNRQLAIKGAKTKELKNQGSRKTWQRSTPLWAQAVFLCLPQDSNCCL